FFFSSRSRHTRFSRDWTSDVCSSDLLVITDIFMPDTDGLEIVSKFRRDFPNVKIIAISGGGSLGMMELLSVAKRLGAHRTLMKRSEERRVGKELRSWL